MGEAADRLTGYIASDDKYDIAHGEVRDMQVAAMNERFQERRGQIKLLAHRAVEAGLDEIRSHADMAKILFPHTAYKSYPEAWLLEERWDRLGKWLDTVSTHRVPPQDASAHDGIDAWLDHLAAQGFFVSCSSGTTGKSAMLVASARDLEWVKKDSVASYTWGSGVKAANDRRIFGTGAVAHTPRNNVGGQAYVDALQDPTAERYSPAIPPLTVGALTSIVVMRKKLADGVATPDEIAEMERTSAQRQKWVCAVQRRHFLVGERPTRRCSSRKQPGQAWR